MTSEELRKTFLNFFAERGHTIAPSSSLISDDPTVLLTTAGMQQFIPYFMGDKEPPAKRYTTIQKCFRTPDIEEVGDDSHLTFFEMLGHFSIGDYFKADAIPWAWEFLTQTLGISKDKLWITIFEGEPARDGRAAIPADDEARKLWLELGVSEDRIVAAGRPDNFWGPPGESGPCGPNAEVHIDRGVEHSRRKDEHACDPSCECGRFLELWNSVFMEYFCAEDGSLTPLPAKNIDEGAGLERIAMVLQGVPTIYETDLFVPLIKRIETLCGKKYEDHRSAFRIIADHARGATFLIADGVKPGKSGSEYILRRVIRRAVVQGHKLDLHKHFMDDLAQVVIEQYKEHYSELDKPKLIKMVLETEEQGFRKTIEKGLAYYKAATESGSLSAADVFYLSTTLGYPVELTQELAKEEDKSLEVDFADKLNVLFKEHQEKSRIGAMEKFQRKGGGQGQEVEKAHTATHLLQQALRDVLGAHVTQAGSRLFDDELSFDFTHPEKMTDEQKAEVEHIVNEKIQQRLPMVTAQMGVEEAKEQGATGLFEEKYGDTVQVCSIMEGDKPYSRELCGGPHVENTSQVELFKIIKEKSSSAGIRRIKAVVGKKAT